MAYEHLIITLSLPHSLPVQDYHWWWRSFFLSGSASYYVLAYAIIYYYTKVTRYSGVLGIRVGLTHYAAIYYYTMVLRLGLG